MSASGAAVDAQQSVSVEHGCVLDGGRVRGGKSREEHDSGI